MAALPRDDRYNFLQVRRPRVGQVEPHYCGIDQFLAPIAVSLQMAAPASYVAGLGRG